MPLYALRPRRNWRWNYAALYVASHYKDKLMGVYYFPSTGLYAPVFSIKDLPGRHRWAFVEIRKSEVSRAYKMICVECGACCARNSGAYAFPHELTTEERESLPFEVLSLPRVGDVLVYWLDVKTAGMCAFYDEKKNTCAVEDRKPIACLVHYCTLFAERKGEVYVKVAVKKDGKIVYRRSTRTEIRKIAKRLRGRVRAFTGRIPRETDLSAG